MSNVYILFDNSDMVLELDGVRNETSGTFLNAAVATVTLKDSAGVSVTGQTWPLTLSYVPLSDGVYRAGLSNALAITPGSRYVALINVDAGAGLRAEWQADCICSVRR